MASANQTAHSIQLFKATSHLTTSLTPVNHTHTLTDRLDSPINWPSLVKGTQMKDLIYTAIALLACYTP